MASKNTWYRQKYERFYKCCILPHIIVHHINGDHGDNRIENLQLMTQKKHLRLHRINVVDMNLYNYERQRYGDKSEDRDP
jgi:hypothetical protein